MKSRPVPDAAFTGKVVLLWAGEGSISEAVVSAFRAAGARVATVSSSPASADLALSDPGAAPEPVAQLFDAVEVALAPVDILIFDHSAVARHAAESTGWQEWRRLATDKLDSVFLVGTEFARRQFKRQASGDILIIAPNHANGGAAGNSAGAVLAAGLASLVQSWSVEWLIDDIRAVIIEVGHIAGSPSAAFALADDRGVDPATSVPLGRLGTADDIAAMVLFLASPYASYIAGTSVRVDGGEWLRANLGGNDFAPPRTWANRG